MGNLVKAPEIKTQISRVIHLDFIADEAPPNFEVSRGATHLEVVDIDNQEDPEPFVPETAPPGFDGLETDRNQVGLAVLLPVTPRVRVAVKGEQEWANGVGDGRVPMGGPLVPR